MTAIGLFEAITLAFSIAAAKDKAAVGRGSGQGGTDAPTTWALPPFTTSLTNPISSASLAPKSRPVSASSRTLLSLPVTLGRRCRVPISAARPTLTSEMANLVSDAHSRISHAAAMSIARPRAKPWSAQMTGWRQAESDEMADWKARRWLWSASALRAGSAVGARIGWDLTVLC